MFNYNISYRNNLHVTRVAVLFATDDKTQNKISLFASLILMKVNEHSIDIVGILFIVRLCRLLSVIGKLYNTNSPSSYICRIIFKMPDSRLLYFLHLSLSLT